MAGFLYLYFNSSIHPNPFFVALHFQRSALKFTQEGLPSTYLDFWKSPFGKGGFRGIFRNLSDY